jgi:bacterioferritin-associated ferredoxin
MYVCLCKGITDTQIKNSIKNGANSLKDVRRELGVATQCCKCLPEARAIVQQSQAQSAPLFSPALFFSAETQT